MFNSKPFLYNGYWVTIHLSRQNPKKWNPESRRCVDLCRWLKSGGLEVEIPSWQLWNQGAYGQDLVFMPVETIEIWLALENLTCLQPLLLCGQCCDVDKASGCPVCSPKEPEAHQHIPAVQEAAGQGLKKLRELGWQGMKSIAMINDSCIGHAITLISKLVTLQ